MDKVTRAPEYQWLLIAAVGCKLGGCAQGVIPLDDSHTVHPPLSAAPSASAPHVVTMSPPNASQSAAGASSAGSSVAQVPGASGAGVVAAPVAGATASAPIVPIGVAGAGANAVDGSNAPAWTPPAAQPTPSVPQPTCPEASQARKPGQYTETLMTRTYALQIPSNYDGTQPVALVFDYHTFNGSAEVQAGYSGWRKKGNEAGFIVVEPQGVANAWNGGSCCSRSTTDDIAFTKAIAAKVSQEFCVDSRRVYATGLANGGAMAHRLACEAADFIAASAPVSMGGLSTCSPARPITIVEFRGRNDPTVPYNGGRFRGAEVDFSAWAKANGCTGEPRANSPMLSDLTDPSDGCRTYDQCKGGATVTLCSPPAAHVLYNDPSPAAQVADIAWQIFQAHPMP